MLQHTGIPLFSALEREEHHDTKKIHIRGSWENKQLFARTVISVQIVANFYYNLGIIHKNKDLEVHVHQSVTISASGDGEQQSQTEYMIAKQTPWMKFR